MRFVKISHSRKISVFSLSSKAEQGLPDVLTRAPPSSFPSCFTNLFRKIFSWTEVRLPHPPRWSEVQRRPLASDPNGGSSPTTTKARRPILLVEMIHQGRKARFSLQRGETRPRGSSRRDGNPGYQRRREEKTSVLKNHTFSCQKLCGVAGRRHYQCPPPGPPHPASTPAECPLTNVFKSDVS